MADPILTNLEEVENTFLENIATFIQAVTRLPVFLIDKPYPKNNDPAIGIKIINTSDSGGWSSKYKIEDGKQYYIMDTTFILEIRAYRGRPMMTLTYLLAALRGFEEAKYQYLYSKNIGFLSASNVTEANTVYDGNQTEQRSRLVANFNMSLICDDLPLQPEIEKVRFTLNSYESFKNEENKLTLIDEFIYTT